MLKNIYIQNESKKSFKDWDKEGLEFLLSYDDILPEIKNKAQQKLNSTIDKRNTTPLSIRKKISTIKFVK
jgi:hypothetical protein